MTRVFAGIVLVFLAGCTPEPPAPVLMQDDLFRDPSAQIASQTNVTADRLAGEWFVRQRFASRLGSLHKLELSVLPGGALQMHVVRRDCSEGTCNGVETLVMLAPTGPGRWTPVDPPADVFDAELWVMWMDFDDRTAAIGTPSGEFGWIMDKHTAGGADRITAARDIMDWFGYNLARLEQVR